MAATQTENVADTAINTFQMRPSESFKSAKVKKVIETVLQKTLNGKKYTDTQAKLWSKTISDEVSKQVKELDMRKYKHVVQVKINLISGRFLYVKLFFSFFFRLC